MLPVKYVPRLEFDEVKTALEIAEEEYRHAVNEADKWDKISCEISDKCGEYNDVLEAFNKEFRNLEGRYKRSTRSDTRTDLYHQMFAVRRQIEEIEPAIDWLQRMFDKASTQYIRSYNDELAAKRNVVNARAAAGLKFGVHVNLENGGKKIPLSANVKTIADAVNFICQNTNGLINWLIYTESVNGLTTRRSVIAESKNIDSEIFFALIKKYGDSTTVIDAEIATPQEATAPHFDTPAEEFKAIAFRAMHCFTLGDFLTPIDELRAFCRKNELPDAERELLEWVQIATDNGVEVPTEFVETPAAEATVETVDAVTQVSKFGVSVITSKPNKRGALICYVNGKKISYRRAEELYRSGGSKVIWCYGLDEAETAERVKQTLRNNPFAVETFSLAPADLPDVEESASSGIIHDTQFAICTITSWLPVIRRHEKVAAEWKAERAALRAGTITVADLKHDDVPDFCNDDIFSPDEFLQQDYDLLNHYAECLRQNISRLKAGVDVLTAAGYLQRAKNFTSWLVQAEKRLDFL